MSHLLKGTAFEFLCAVIDVEYVVERSRDLVYAVKHGGLCGKRSMCAEVLTRCLRSPRRHKPGVSN